MSQVTLSLSAAPGAFLPMANKAGKVTATAEKVAATLNSMSNAALVGAALTSKGAIGKQAQAALIGGAVTLQSLLAAESLDGGQWGDLFALLRGAYGVADYNRSTMRGRAGAVAYVGAVRVSLVQRFDRAETVKAQDNAYKALQAFDVVAADVHRLSTAADSAAMLGRDMVTAEQATAEQATAEQATAALWTAKDAKDAAEGLAPIGSIDRMLQSAAIDQATAEQATAEQATAEQATAEQ